MRYFQNIKPKIILSLLLIVVGVLIASETYHYVDTKKVLYAELEELAERKITRMAEGYVIPLWEVDGDWVKRDIDTEMMDKRVYALVVRGEGDIFEGSMRDKQWQVVTASGDISGDYITRESDVVHHDEKIGSIKIYLSKKFVNEELRGNIMRAVLTITLISVLMLYFMVVVLNKIIIRPLQNVLEVTTSIAEGDYSRDVDITQTDEVGKLAGGVNHMRNSICLREQQRDRAEAQLTQKSIALESANIELEKYHVHLEEQVVLRTAELEKANKQLQELDKLKSMFIASMSHELRTPLNSIIGFTSITLDGLTGEINATQRDQLQRVYRAGKHLLSLINDVIDISKVEAGRTDVFPSEFSLQEIVDEAVGNIQPMADKKQLSLNVVIPSKTTMLYTDRQRLLQCLLNLMSNAVKFTESGNVIVSAQEIGNDVEFVVKDTGIGIEESDLSRLFEAFERLDSHLRIKAGGTGLGLYLTRKICTSLLQGKVWVESKLGIGSTFSIRIPRHLGK